VIALIVIAALVVVAVVGWLQLHRHGESHLPAESWQRTDEVFRDPSSGRVMRVWIEPNDGSRHYVPEPHGTNPT
jgi:hypothetical protein